MAKPPKISVKTLLQDCDYWSKLSVEEKEWLMKFELTYRFGMNTTKQELSAANARNYRKRTDWLNNTPEKIIGHMIKNNENKRLKKRRKDGVVHKEKEN